jgi:hypothetical protein
MLVANPEGSGKKCVLWRAHPDAQHVRMLGHWMALPEDLRSELLRSYSRDEFANYHQALVNAVEKWRHAGIWRMPAKL